MAEESFYDDWRITTKEEVEILLKAFEDADKRGPRKRMDVRKMIEEGERLLREGRFNDL
ncbi:MAG: hypothetical protein LBR42_02635 [Candidatus Methanoplasma sp.]|jgi:hypothetical protein|nr:hypothetical protein [Candidatus Methanoplasma sp.]